MQCAVASGSDVRRQPDSGGMPDADGAGKIDSDERRQTVRDRAREQTLDQRGRLTACLSPYKTIARPQVVAEIELIGRL
jgi:hypothetical protein